ncbi:MAG TPA: PEP-CTERM sorting domain-containing protein [Terriglobia bacterium]|nr:PEP-CTERM sorting domain-containing protein [Terriglobia bacterium]
MKLLKTRFTWLSLAAILCLLMAAPASADTLYDNGPINGTVDAWTINFGYQVSNSFTLGAGSTLTGAQIGLWLSPGDSPTSVNWSIGTTPYDSSLGSGTGVLTDTFQSTNPYGYSLDESTFSLGGTLAAGTYYLTLQNLAIPSGGPGYWDQNSGPSSAYESAVGSLGAVCGNGYPGPVGGTCSESFQIYGNSGTATPEPASLVLLGSGMLIFAGFMRKFAS